jgi:hypothetical protein
MIRALPALVALFALGCGGCGDESAPPLEAAPLCPLALGIDCGRSPVEIALADASKAGPPLAGHLELADAGSMDPPCADPRAQDEEHP